jgi:CheY-like chemotaxis protein
MDDRSEAIRRERQHRMQAGRSSLGDPRQQIATRQAEPKCALPVGERERLPMILVVDDELAIALMLEALLTDEGYQVVTAGSGRQALARLVDVRPDLILCDVMLPGLDGREVCRTVQSDPNYQATPVVLMSAGYRSVARAEYPYAAFVRKPFLVPALLATIEQVLGRAGCLLRTPPSLPLATTDHC